MLLPTLSSLAITPGKRVLVRADLDLPAQAGGDFRLETLIPTLTYLSERKAQITIIGHNGRPEGKVVPELSLKPLDQKLRALIPQIQFTMLENLRFDPGEEGNSPEFAQHLASQADVFVNEAFASSHRAHASIVGLPKLLPHAAGLRFAEEVANLSRVLENPERPVLAIISGVKKDKLDYLQDFKRFCDRILVGGRLPEFLGEDFKDDKITVARLVPDKEDITLNSIDTFKAEISVAKTILVAGVVGKYEDPGHLQGSQEVFAAIAQAQAFKVAGGGDTTKALQILGVTQGFNWISVGGGAMLEFLAKGTLPGIEALQEGG